MPSRLSTPVLTVDAGKMHQVDTRNVENLFGMWMVFSKCADSMEEGRRLENMSWRLWNRETFCCEPQPQLATTPAIPLNIPPRPTSRDVPDLSASVDSVVSDDSDRIEQERNPPATAPLPFKKPSDQDSALSRSRGKEKHITSFGLEKMVYSIKEKKLLEPLSPAIASFAHPVTDITPRPLSPSTMASSQHHKYSTESCASTADSNVSQVGLAGSETTVSSGELVQSHSVVRGFSPGRVSSSYRSGSNLAPAPAPMRSILQTKSESSKKKTGMFQLGGSSGDDESSFEERMSYRPKQSSLSEGLHNTPLQAKKQLSFREVVESRTIKPIREGTNEDEDAIESDDEEEVSESAIEDDDDESDWEDSVSESGRSSPVEDKQLFQRVDSRPNLTSRRSLLTSALHEPQRAAALAMAASRSSPALQRSQRSRTSSPNGPSIAASPEEEDPSALTMRGPDIPHSKPIIMTTSNTHPPAHSPRTTRRNMLATELTESLRKHLLWERQQKSTTANAVFKRRHTALDISKLQDFPAKPGQASKDASKNNSWNHYFDYGPWEYHLRGW